MVDRIVCDGIDGEVAARQILVQRGPELDDGVTAIGLYVAAKGRDFMHHVVLVEHTDRAELDPDRYGAPEELAHLRRGRRGGEIPVEVRLTQKRVAYGSADTPGFESGLLERAGDIDDLARRAQSVASN